MAPLSAAYGTFQAEARDVDPSYAPATVNTDGWALLYNFATWSPAMTQANDQWRYPAERLNRHRHHDDWLRNLLISASLGGYRNAPRNP